MEVEVSSYIRDDCIKRCPRTTEEMNIPFDFDTYQKTDMFQFLHAGYSTWYLMCKYFRTKKEYYRTGTSELTDLEFDSLERTIGVSNPKGFLDQFGCVGYNKNQHNGAKICLDFYDSEIKRRYTDPHNRCADESRIKREARQENEEVAEVINIRIEKKIEEVIIEKVYEENELGQLQMF